MYRLAEFSKQAYCKAWLIIPEVAFCFCEINWKDLATICFVNTRQKSYSLQCLMQQEHTKIAKRYYPEFEQLLLTKKLR